MAVNLKDLPANLQKQVMRKMNEAEGRKGGKIPVPPPEPKKNKLHAEKCGKYASRHEAKRAWELKMLERAGKISDLREQVKYVLVPAIYRKPDGTLVKNYDPSKNKRDLEKAEGCKLELLERNLCYVADFVYEKDGQTVVEDAKGFKKSNAALYEKYVHKRKLMLHLNGIRVAEV